MLYQCKSRICIPCALDECRVAPLILNVGVGTTFQQYANNFCSIDFGSLGAEVRLSHSFHERGPTLSPARIDIWTEREHFSNDSRNS